jgi:hypothetical protein
VVEEGACHVGSALPRPKGVPGAEGSPIRGPRPRWKRSRKTRTNGGKNGDPRSQPRPGRYARRPYKNRQGQQRGKAEEYPDHMVIPTPGTNVAAISTGAQPVDRPVRLHQPPEGNVALQLRRPLCPEVIVGSASSFMPRSGSKGKGLAADQGRRRAPFPQPARRPDSERGPRPASVNL